MKASTCAVQPRAPRVEDRRTCGAATDKFIALYRRFIAELWRILSGVMANFIAGVWLDYRRIIAGVPPGVWEFHCQSTAEVQRHYGPRSDKFIEILSQPLPSTLSESTFPCGPSSIPGPSNFLVPGSCSLRQSRVRSPVGTLFQADMSSIPSSQSRIPACPEFESGPGMLQNYCNAAIIQQ